MRGDSTQPASVPRGSGTWGGRSGGGGLGATQVRRGSTGGGLGALGATWAALRRAWDLATPDARFAFRRAVMARLASKDRRAAIEALVDSRALMENGLKPGADVVVGDLLRRAFELTSAERAALLALLDVEPKAHQLGW